MFVSGCKCCSEEPEEKEKNSIMQVNLPVNDLPFLRRGVSGAWGGNVYKGIVLFLHRGLQRASEDITQEKVLNISVKIFVEVGRQHLWRFRFMSHMSLKVSTTPGEKKEAFCASVETSPKTRAGPVAYSFQLNTHTHREKDAWHIGDHIDLCIYLLISMDSKSKTHRL